MSKKIINTNRVTLKGEIKSEFIFSHTISGINFYEATISIRRFSGLFDLIPIIVPETLIDFDNNYIGKYVHITGRNRSRNYRNNDKHRVKLSVSVKSMEVIESESIKEVSNNSIILDGFICKNPIVRRTTATYRDITELIIAVNRPDGNADYIPCICWAKQSKLASEFTVGDYIKIHGRIQSRQYIKKIDDIEETRTAYEVSVFKLELL